MAAPIPVRRHTFLLALAWMLVASSTVAIAGIRDERPNCVGGELLGRGLAGTLNYERFFNNHWGVGGGIMAIGGAGGMLTILPAYVSFVPGNEHSLYLAGGGAWLGGVGSVQDFEGTWLVQGSLGYQYQSTSGFFVRPFFTYINDTHGGADFLVWPGLTIGGSF